MSGKVIVYSEKIHMPKKNAYMLHASPAASRLTYLSLLCVVSICLVYPHQDFESTTFAA